MIKQTITDFAGGIQESSSPDDFSGRQWSQLLGVVPKNSTTFESQWPMQSMSAAVANEELWLEDATAFKEVFPLESSSQTYLVGIKNDGSIWWCYVAAEDTGYAAVNATTWYQITEAENTGIAFGELNPILVHPNPGFRFVTGLNLPVYKYIKTPFPGRESDFGQDLLPDTIVDYDGTGEETVVESLKSRANVPAVLIGCRRSLKFVAGDPIFDMRTFNNAQMPSIDHAMLIAYVDPRVENGAIKVISFPNLRRWPTFKRNFAVNDEDGVPIANWPQVTVDGVVYGVEERGYPIVPFNATTSEPQGADRTFTLEYPYTGIGPWGSPSPITAFHPYTYLDLNSALLPGRGIMPRGNIGTMWNNQLILGDIEWRSDKAFQATDGDGKVSPGFNRALVGTPALTDGNTEAHRGHFYYSLGEPGSVNTTSVDIFDPRTVFNVSGTDARIAGMHQIDNYLVCITTHSGPNDGVFALSGNLSSMISYAGISNPAAVRKQLLRGGVGVADGSEDGDGYRSQTCLWPEASNVVFIDKSGTIYSTDGRRCEAIDRVGPVRPKQSYYNDHVAAMGKHLVAWRNSRMLVLSLLESDGEQASGCWTELVYPGKGGIVAVNPRDLTSMVGTATQMFMVIKGQVWRFVPAGPEAEKGRINNVPVTIEVSTAVLGDHTGAKKTNWFRVGFSFFTPTTCTVSSVTTKAESIFTTGTPSPNPSTVPSYTVPVSKSYTSGHYELVIPAGVGPQTVITAKFSFTGNIVLKGFSYWSSAGTMERGEKT
jgi:hypothetical protein